MKAICLNPSEGSVLILLNAGTLKKELKERARGAKQIVLDIREKEIPAWLQERARLKGFEISEATAAYLLGVVGPDLGMLSSELEKLMLTGEHKDREKGHRRGRRGQEDLQHLCPYRCDKGQGH